MKCLGLTTHLRDNIKPLEEWLKDHPIENTSH